MSLSNKITLLILLLLAVMATCVYTHIDDFEPKTATPLSLNEEIVIPTEENEANLEEQTIKEKSDNIEQLEESDEQKVEEKIEKAPVVEVQKEEETTPTLQVTAEVQTLKQEPVKAEVQQEVPQTNKAVQDEINSIIEQSGIIFKRMSYNVTPKSMETIEAVAVILKKYPLLHFEVAGHTDAKGDESFNQFVSEQRAQSVMKILIDLGVEPERLTAKGYGETMPIVPNDPQGYSLVNRRVEINIVEE